MHNENTYCHMSDACKIIKQYKQILGDIKGITNELKRDAISSMSIRVSDSIVRILNKIKEVENVEHN